MKTWDLYVIAALAAGAGGAFADTSVQSARVASVSDVDGRATVMTMQTAGPVMSRPADGVMPGPIVEQGSIATTVQQAVGEVDKVEGHS